MVPSQVVYAAVPVSVIVAIGLLRKWRSRNWAKCTSNTCLRGKTFIITGANSGIGLETAKALVRRKARVIFACRDIAKAKEAIAEIRKEQPSGGELVSDSSIKVTLPSSFFFLFRHFVLFWQKDKECTSFLLKILSIYFLQIIEVGLHQSAPVILICNAV